MIVISWDDLNYEKKGNSFLAVKHHHMSDDKTNNVTNVRNRRYNI